MTREKIRRRTLAREMSLKILFAVDIAGGELSETFEQIFMLSEINDSSVKKFAWSLIKGFFDNSSQIDELISEVATNWHLDRMATIDRNIIRVAVYELILTHNVPPKVVINEAIEIAKKYGDVGSGKFVNGILDKVKTLYAGKKDEKGLDDD